MELYLKNSGMQKKVVGNKNRQTRSPYQAWDYSNPETAVLGVAFHVFECFFVRVAPFIFIGAMVAIFLMWKKE